MPVLHPQHPVLVAAPDVQARGTDLRGALIVGVDLGEVDLVWEQVDATDAVFARCPMSDATERMLRDAGATILHRLEGIEFEPFRTTLYSYAELSAGYVEGRPETALDARIGAVSTRMGPADVLARGIHDVCIEAALMRFLDEAGAPVVGIMGSHITPRGDSDYREVATLARRFTRDGFIVATGGGPGLMEAANLGAWLAPADDGALDEAFEILSTVPSYEPDPGAYVDRAIEVRQRWPQGATSLGVPTWIYVDEPFNQFATHIAKYFQNSIRENGLLAIAHAGIVYTPGGSGTLQELFTDAAQNEYTLYDVRSPMILMGAEYRSGRLTDATAALQKLAERGGWGRLVRVVDDADGAFESIRELLPSEVMPPRPALRRR
ncbi:MAG: Rossmann fold nucleotide-binding protein [Actinobacteria bacterium]|nr:Rossmann fold nucleotide-binding protein [Actinomycetota bacterium]